MGDAERMGRGAGLSPEEAVRQVVRAMLARYSWQLVPEAVLVAEVLARLAAAVASPGPKEIERLCKQEMGELLFDACVRGALHSATPGERQQAERAYHDLDTYLTRLAQYEDLPPGADWADVVQETLIAIHADHRRCAQPGAFLAWAVTILRYKAKDAWSGWHPSTSLDTLPEEQVDQEKALAAPAPTRDRHVDPQGDQDVLRILHDCLATDEERMWALNVGYFGLKRRELEIMFDTPLARLDRVGMTVKKKLRKCTQFLALFGRHEQAA